MVTYLSKFTANISEATHSLRQLLKTDAAWVWDANMQRDFEFIKEKLTKAPVLQFFNKDEPLTLSVDASQFGLGATLLQNDKPVGYGSATLTEAQRRYAQIEKELLAVIFGLEHFHYYTYGRQLVVQTDHKPLLGLSKKPYDNISPRLQRMLLRMTRYDVQLEYVPGKLLTVADAFSRAPLPNVRFEETPSNDSTAEVSLLIQASSTKWIEFQSETEKDKTLQDVVYHVREGWPEEKNKVRASARPFWHCRDELHESDGLLCRGQRLVVPAKCQQSILETLHMSHRGIVACKVKAREYVYWPSMNSDIEQFVSSCIICQRHQRSNQHEPLLDRELPVRPWQKVACDFFDLKGQRYLLMVDYFSKYVELQLMHGTTAKAVINAMKTIYARHGIPEEIVTDQGPPYDSEELKSFHDAWGIRHNPSSPLYPRSNGQVERSVQTLKLSLLKAEEDGKDLHIVLLDYRITPTDGLPSPAELLMGRRLRSMIPSHPDRLQPNFDIHQAKSTLKERQEKQKKFNNKGTKTLTTYKEGDQIWFRLKTTEPWTQGKIIKVGPQPRTYAIEAYNGRIYTRNRFYVRPFKSSNGQTADQQTSASVPQVTKQQKTVQRTAEDYYTSLEPNSRVLRPRRTPDVQTDAQPTEPLEEVQMRAPVVPTAQECRENTTVPISEAPAPSTRSGRTVKKPARYKN